MQATETQLNVAQEKGGIYWAFHTPSKAEATGSKDPNITSTLPLPLIYTSLGFFAVGIDILREACMVAVGDPRLTPPHLHLQRGRDSLPLVLGEGLCLA